jgi:hypothetical protein
VVQGVINFTRPGLDSSQGKGKTSSSFLYFFFVKLHWKKFFPKETPHETFLGSFGKCFYIYKKFS